MLRYTPKVSYLFKLYLHLQVFMIEKGILIYNYLLYYLIFRTNENQQFDCSSHLIKERPRTGLPELGILTAILGQHSQN